MEGPIDSPPKPFAAHTPPTVSLSDDLKTALRKYRAEIEVEGEHIRALHEHPDFRSEQTVVGQHAEMHANITLAYRHLEDARMRLGKVIQAMEGGVSCYNK